MSAKSCFFVRSFACVSFLAFAIPATTGLAACGSSNSGSGMTKGGGAQGSAAQDAMQTVGSTASSDTTDATDDGASYESVTCDDSAEGVAWCDSDTEIVFCSGGSFYSLDCTSISGDFCGNDGTTIDCYADSDF